MLACLKRQAMVEIHWRLGMDQRGTKETKDTTNMMSPPAKGIEFAMPRRDVLDDATVDRYRVADTDAGVDDLMAQLKNLQSGDAR